MFTDNPTIPAQLEVLLDVIHEMRARRASAEVLRQLIQPKGLPDLTANSRQVAQHLSAAQELKLVTTTEDNDVRLNYSVHRQHSPKDAILKAFDRIALSDALVEKWAGRFYAFLIVQDDDTCRDSGHGEILADRFMSGLQSSIDKGNPMNRDKYRALLRWYPYVGLGWKDPSDAFVPDPTDRIARALPAIWQDTETLEAGDFMARLGRACPELDGGVLFNEVTVGTYTTAARQCTRALASALRRLHDNGRLKLHCPADSTGWSLEKGGQGPVSGEASNRFDSVTYVTRRQNA